MDRVAAWVGRLAIAFLYLPIAAVVIGSFNAGGSAARWEGFSLRWYRQLASDGELLRAAGISTLVGAVTAVVAAAIGMLAAIGLARYRGRATGVVLGAIVLPLVVPEIVLGVALLTLFTAIGVPLGIVTIVLGHVVVTLPLTTLVLLGAMRSLDPSLLDAAADLGCTPWQTLARVLFPLLRSALGAAALLAFTVSLGNIVISTFVSGVGSTTLPLRVYSLLKTGLTPELNALATLLIVLTATVVAGVGVRQLRRIIAPPGVPTRPGGAVARN